MPRTCSVCTHVDRLAIERLLVDGVSYRNIAKQHGVSFAAVARHRTDHLPQLLADSRPLEVVPKRVSKRDTVSEQPADLQTYVEERADDNHQHAIDVIRTTARQVERLELLSNAVDDWLRDPIDPTKYSIEPRAGDVFVIYREVAGEVAEGIPFYGPKQKKRLSELLARLDSQPLEIEATEWKHADPRELLGKVADGVKGQMQLSVQLLDKLYGAEQVEIFQQAVLDAIAEVDPDVRDRIQTAIGRRLAGLRAPGPTLR